MAMMANKKEFEKIGKEVAKQHGGKLQAMQCNSNPYELSFVVKVNKEEKLIKYLIDENFRNTHRMLW